MTGKLETDQASDVGSTVGFS